VNFTGGGQAGGSAFALVEGGANWVGISLLLGRLAVV
jgi:hypothetical protein